MTERHGDFAWGETFGSIEGFGAAPGRGGR